MTTGQKVVCVDDVFPQWVKALYTALPVKGQVYVVRGTAPGVTFFSGRKSEGELCVYLIGLHNPRSGVEPFREFGFHEIRFRPLDEMQRRNTERETVADAIGVEA